MLFFLILILMRNLCKLKAYVWIFTVPRFLALNSLSLHAESVLKWQTRLTCSLISTKKKYMSTLQVRTTHKLDLHSRALILSDMLVDFSCSWRESPCKCLHAFTTPSQECKRGYLPLELATGSLWRETGIKSESSRSFSLITVQELLLCFLDKVK